jgi:hypothetical protein
MRVLKRTVEGDEGNLTMTELVVFELMLLGQRG